MFLLLSGQRVGNSEGILDLAMLLEIQLNLSPFRYFTCRPFSFMQAKRSR